MRKDSYSHILLIKQPWIDLILSGHKTWEIRGSDTNIRGKIGLAESGSGKVLGTAELVGSIRLTSRTLVQSIDRHRVESPLQAVKYSSPHAWVLANPHRYARPKPYLHTLGAVVWVKV
jgi:hypothetical protein